MQFQFCLKKLINFEFTKSKRYEKFKENRKTGNENN